MLVDGLRQPQIAMLAMGFSGVQGTCSCGHMTGLQRGPPTTGMVPVAVFESV
jgi:hypothetical protein